MHTSGQEAEGCEHPTEPRLRLEDYLPYKLNVLAEAVREPLLRYYLQSHDVGVPEWRITALLAQHRSLTAKDICRIGRMHKTKVSRALAFLEARGFVRREANMSDLRESFVSLTEAGRALYENLVDAARDYGERLASVLDENERAAFEAMLQRLQSRSDALAREWREDYDPGR
jgi:DNA-binding MarR family transcriptional regulator